MSLLQYLDEEFFKLQDFLGVVSDGLPHISLDRVKDDTTLFKQIIDQNKAYARKIMTLIEKVDKLFKANTSNVDKSMSSDNSVLIHRKINEYESNIKRLENENDEFLKQIKQLTKQVKSLHTKQTDTSSTEIPKESIVLSNAPSPIQRSTFKANYSSNEPNYDIEYYMSQGDYKKTVEVLIQNDYRKPSFVPFEKFCGWLVAVNKLKDSQLNDILSKIKILINFASENPDRELDESIDMNPAWNNFEKIQFLLEDKLPRVVMQSGDPQFKSLQDDGLHKSTAKFQDTRELDTMDDDSAMDREQLRMKVKYLNSNLRDLERQHEEAIREIEHLRSKTEKQVSHTRQKSAQKTNSKYTSPEKLIKENETLLQNVDNEMKARYEAEAQLRSAEIEAEQFKKRVQELEGDLGYNEKRYRDLSGKMEENTALINRLIEENNNLREHNDRLEEGSSFGGRNFSRTQRSPEPRFQDSMIEHPRSTTKGGTLKNNILVESSLQIQSNTLYNLKQMVSDLKNSYAELINQFNINITLKSFRDSAEDIQPNSEALQLIKNNTSTIKEIQNDVEYVRSTGSAIINYLSDSRKRVDTTTLYNRLSAAEEKIYESIANSIHNLSKVTSLIHELPSQGYSSSTYADILSELQNLHTNLSKMIEEFPEFAPERASAEKYDSLPKDSKSTHNTSFFRDRLNRDQQEIHLKLKEALKQFEKKTSNDTINHLEKEMERNQELQNKIEAKNLIIHKLQLIFNEGNERTAGTLTQLSILADSDDAQRLVNFINTELNTMKSKFKDVIGLHKDSNLDAKGLARIWGLEHSPQRETHSRSRKELPFLGDPTADRYIRELELEKESHRKTYNALVEAQRAQKVAEEMSKDLKTLNTAITDRERELYQKDERFEELLGRFRIVERDCIELAEKNKLFADEINFLQNENQGLRINLEKLREENFNFGNKIREIQDVRNRDLEILQKQLEGVRNENLDLRQYKDATDSALKKTHDHLDHIKLNYFSEVTHLKETNVNLNARTEKLITELEKKNHEINKMNQMLDNLQAFSNRQLENIQQKDDRIAELNDKKREYEIIINDLERNIQELTQRNQRNVENMTQSIYDTNKIKDDFQNLLERNEDMAREIDELRKQNYELEAQNRGLSNNRDIITTDKFQLEERISKINEINQITRTEVKNYKDIIDKRNKHIETLEAEIRDLRNSLTKSREPNQESELIGHLKRELKARGDELSLLRQDYQRAVETIEKYRIEVETLRAANKLNEQHLRELDKVSSINRSIGSEYEAMKKTFRLKEEQYAAEKDTLEKENGILKRKNMDLQAVIESKESSRSKQQSIDGFKWDQSRSSSDSIYYNNLIESKDSEIKRLTQIVRNLTDNLRDAQESKFSLKK